jgi:phosphatidyl-myo-inositol alpha-mannosyltransferase
MAQLRDCRGDRLSRQGAVARSLRCTAGGRFLAFPQANREGAFMRVALVTEYYFPHLGGVTEHVYNLAKLLNHWGHPTIVITAHMTVPSRDADTGEDDEDAPFVRRIGRSRVIYSAGSFARVTTGIGLRRQVRQILQDEQIDVVHVHGGLAPVLGLVAPLAAQDLDIPAVATFHSWFARSALLGVFRRTLQRRLDRHAAAIAVSQPVVEAHSRYLKAAWQIIPNGVDTDFFRPQDRPSAYGSRPPELLFLGRLDPRNGLDTILAAMPAVLVRVPDVRLTIAGDGPLRPVYERMAKSASRQVTFVGRVNGNRPAYYSRADLYLCPTTMASFGVTLLEAMACGTPLVVSDITGFRELVGGGDEAVMVHKHDPAAWAEAIVGLLGDERRRSAMRAAGLTKSEGFAWPRIAEQVMEVYRRVLEC